MPASDAKLPGTNASRRVRAGQLCVAGVFLAAGLLKIWDPPGFALALARLEVLPRAWIGPAAVWVPWIEVTAAVAAFTPWRSAGLAILAGLLAVFTAVLAVAWAGGRAASCGCFGADGGFWGRLDVGLARNLLLGAVLALTCRRSAPASPASASPR